MDRTDRRTPLVLLAVSFALACSGAAGARTTGSLRATISLPNAITNGVAIAPDGRTYLVIAKQRGQTVPQIARYVDGALRPFPDAAWNAWKPGADASHAFVHANSIRFGPDGTLWVVDFGAQSLEPVVPHGPKLVGFDATTGAVTHLVYLDSVTRPSSAVDDVRFNGTHAYITDAGSPGIIVRDQRTGALWRALDRTPPVTERRPLMADGRAATNERGEPTVFHADQLEVSPDGKILYFQPASGPMYAIETAYLDARGTSDAERLRHVRVFSRNGSTGGTAIDARGNVYVSQTNDHRVLRVTPAGVTTTLASDPRLLWVDAMWVSADGLLWMPASQLERTPHLDGNKTEVRYPMNVFTTYVGSGPPRIDHR